MYVTVKRVGGAFGAKISRSHQIAAACAIAAYHTRKSVSTGQCMLYAKQKHLGCKKVQGRSEATLQTGRYDQKG